MKNLILIIMVVFLITGCKTNDIVKQEKIESHGNIVTVYKSSEPEIKTADC